MVAAFEVGHAVNAAHLVSALLLAMLWTSTAYAKQYTLIVSGLGGESEYEQRFQTQAKQLSAAATHASEQAQVTLLSGEQATRAAIRATLAEWRTASSTDQIVVTLIGHGTFDGDEYRYNVPGPDVTARDLRDWLQPLQARQLIVLATSASGAALAQLQVANSSNDNRIVITATKSGSERNATRFAEHWVAAFSATEADRDKNEWVTAQEAFDYASRKIADGFKANASLATEHARLEGKRAESVPLGRLGALKEMPSDAELVALFAERLRIENDVAAVKARKQDTEIAAYYSELEKPLIALAKTQRRIDARQVALSKEGSR
jgi:chorismate mutase